MSNIDARTRRSYDGMLYRTTNKNSPKWHRYGGRGITVCTRWRNSIDLFVLDMGIRPAELTLHRINNNGPYSCGKCLQCRTEGWPSNCEWATQQRQQEVRSNLHWVEFEGQCKTMTQWAREYGLNPQTLHMRLENGWTFEEALKTPTPRQRRTAYLAECEANWARLHEMLAARRRLSADSKPPTE